MGLWDKWQSFRESKSQGRYEKALRVVKNPKAIKEDRWACLEYLNYLDDVEKASSALMERFEYSLEHGINDTREKELAMKGIVRFGAAAIPFVTARIAATSRIAWPIKILKEIGTEEQVIAALFGALNFSDVSFDQLAVDKNYDILCYLRDYPLGSQASKLVHFLKDPDERVRFACSEVLIEQHDESLKPSLEPFIADYTVENRRIRQTIIVAFLRNKWKLAHPEVFNEGQVDAGLFVTPQGLLEVRPS